MAVQSQTVLLISCFKTHNTSTGTAKSLLVKGHVWFGKRLSINDPYLFQNKHMITICYI